MAKIHVKNDSDVEVLFSVFNAGGSGIPYSIKWIKANKKLDMDIGNFKKVGVGAQVQSGGVWVSDPKYNPYYSAGDTCVFNITRK
jgi:hypothetical protein